MRRFILAVLILSIAAACSSYYRRRPAGPRRPPPSASEPQLPNPRLASLNGPLPRNGFSEDPDCSYVFTASDSKTYAEVLTALSDDLECRFDGAHGQHTRMIGTWIGPGDQKISMAFFSGTCGSPDKAPGSELVVAEEAELKRNCTRVYDATLKAMLDGRLPRPRKRPDEPMRPPLDPQ